MANTEKRLTQNQLYDTLANERRRAVVRYLLDRDEEVNVKELSTSVADEVADEHPPSDSFQQSTYISLVQTHLPKLDDYGIVRYDADTKVVRPGAALPELADHLGDGDGGGGDLNLVAVGAVGLTVLLLIVGVAVGSATTVAVFLALLVQIGLGAYLLLAGQSG